MFESEFERNLFALRREKLQQIAELGQQAYPNQLQRPDRVPEIRAKYAEATADKLEAERVTVSVAGRIMAIRAQGKAGFAQLQQDGERLQIYVRLDAVGEQGFALYKLLDLGDHIGVTGYLFRTRTGELTVHVETITFLAKAMLALPEKYHGLADVELRYRQRYVDLFMNSRQPAKSSSSALRYCGPYARFFDERGYIEVETPMMQPIAGGAAARPFETHHNALDMKLFLRIAPELYLKRLVVGGLDRVYEINRNFRNEGISTQHNPEFTMLEFYQAYANYVELMELTKELIVFVANEVNGTTIIPSSEVDERTGKPLPRLDESGEPIDLAKWEELTMKEAIQKSGQRVWRSSNNVRLQRSDSFDNFLRTASMRAQRISSVPSGEPAHFQVGNRLDAAVMVARTQLAQSDSPGRAIATIFEAVAEPHLIQPTIIYDFPLAVSPLSKVKPDEPDWVERFEFYIGGFEIGNAFSELNDPEDQRERFEAQLTERARGNEEAHQMDEDYVRALAYGLPPTAGEGIGIDRLTMVLTGAKSIRDVILFPLLRPAQGHAETRE